MTENNQPMCIDLYRDCVHWHTTEIAEIPLNVIDWGQHIIDYYYNNGYTPKQCACAALVNEFGLTRLMISYNRKDRNTKEREIKCDWSSLLIAANMPFVNPVSDIDQYI